MTYKINGTEILQPSEGGWVKKDKLGNTLSGRPVYPNSREFEMKWELMPIDSFNQLLGFYNTVSVSGTLVVDLPQFDGSSFVFHSYSGCKLEEPTPQSYFMDHVTQVNLLVLCVRG